MPKVQPNAMVDDLDRVAVALVRRRCGPHPTDRSRSPTLTNVTVPVRGLSTRDVEAMLVEALGEAAAVSKSTVSRVCEEIQTQFEAWSARRLDEPAPPHPPGPRRRRTPHQSLPATAAQAISCSTRTWGSFLQTCRYSREPTSELFYTAGGTRPTFADCNDSVSSPRRWRPARS